jgi:hypothetical protein
MGEGNKGVLPFQTRCFVLRSAPVADTPTSAAHYHVLTVYTAAQTCMQLHELSISDILRVQTLRMRVSPVACRHPWRPCTMGRPVCMALSSFSCLLANISCNVASVLKPTERGRTPPQAEDPPVEMS